MSGHTIPPIPSADYSQEIMDLMPRGAVWPRDPDSMLVALSKALGPTFSRIRDDAGALVNDLFPATTNAMLTDWENSLGLPDECTPLNPTTEQRRAAVLAKFISTGGQSIPYFTAVAAALGFPITVTEYGPFRVGLNRVGDPLGAPGVTYHWQISSPSLNPIFFRAGLSTAGDPLETIGNTEMPCRLAKIKPAHTVLTFVSV